MRFIHPKVTEVAEAAEPLVIPAFQLPPGVSIIKISCGALQHRWFVALDDERWHAYEDPPYRPVVQRFGDTLLEALTEAIAEIAQTAREFEEAYERKHARLAPPPAPTPLAVDDLLRSIGLA